MSIGDVMRVLGVSRQRVYEFNKKGQLHPQDTTAGKIFLESEVMAFKEERDKRKAMRKTKKK